MKSTASGPAMPKEVEALRTSLESKLTALEKALADPKQHSSLGSLILDLARIATQEADASARQAVLAAQQAGKKLAADARAEAMALLEAEKVASAALRQVIEGAKLALKQAEAALKEERRSGEAASKEVAQARGEAAALQASLEQEQSARANDRRELESALAEVERERGAGAELLAARSELHREREVLTAELAALRGQHESALRDLDGARAELESMRGSRDATQRDLDAARRELEEVRTDSAARTQTLSQSQAEQEQAIRAAQEAARSAEGRADEANRDREAAQAEIAGLRQQLEAAEQALREADAVNRELQAAHEARDAAEVLEATRPSERGADADFDLETVVDLTSDTKDEERELEIDRRTRALELALRDAEERAESAERELARHRGTLPPTPAQHEPVPTAAAGGQDQFRGPARAARRVTFRTDITVQVDGTAGKLVDLSVSGAQVLAPAAINPNRLVTVVLPLDDGTIPCKAKVMWSRLEPRAGQLWYRAGVMFTNADEPALEAFLQAHQS